MPLVNTLLCTVFDCRIPGNNECAELQETDWRICSEELIINLVNGDDVQNKRLLNSKINLPLANVICNSREIFGEDDKYFYPCTQKQLL